MNPEKLLGGLLKGALGSGLKSGKGLKKKLRKMDSMTGGLLGKNQAAIGMGLLGVAIAAFEHFTQQGRQSVGGMGSPNQPAPSVFPPPPPPGPSQSNLPPPPPPVQGGGAAGLDDQANFLVAAMIAAAACDGKIDDQERDNILNRVQEAGLDAEDMEFINKELQTPRRLEEIVQTANRLGLQKETYTVSLIAIHPDTFAEWDYLNKMASGISLDSQTVKELHQQFEGV